MLTTKFALNARRYAYRIYDQYRAGRINSSRARNLIDRIAHRLEKFSDFKNAERVSDVYMRIHG